MIEEIDAAPTEQLPEQVSARPGAWKFILAFLFIDLLVASVLFFAFPYTQQTAERNSPVSNPILQTERARPDAPTPSPIPFEELTIPYLRNRTYSSEIGELKKYSENSNYTSYLTSYQSDGFTINALLTQPKNSTEKSPAIVFVHGYIPPTNYRTTQNYAAYVDYFARRGFVVLKIDLRGHGDSEGEASGAYFSSDYIVDVLHAYDAVGKLPFVDPEKIGLWGHSMAGNVTFRSLAVKRNIPAVAIWAGAVHTYSDMQEFGIDDGSYRPPDTKSATSTRRRQLMETHGSFQPENTFWKLVPATNYLEGVTGSVGLFHATNDPVVSIEYSRNLNSLLERTSIPHELHEYTSGGHNISGAVFSQAMAETVTFFQVAFEKEL